MYFPGSARRSWLIKYWKCLSGRFCGGLAAPGCVISLAPITFFNLDIMLSAGLDSKSGEKIDVRRFN